MCNKVTASRKRYAIGDRSFDGNPRTRYLDIGRIPTSLKATDYVYMNVLLQLFWYQMVCLNEGILMLWFVLSYSMLALASHA